MHFKLIIAFCEDDKTCDVMQAARDAGATGATIIPNARGEGLRPAKTFFGLTCYPVRGARDTHPVVR